MKITVAVLFYLLFWFMCYLGTGTDKKNIKGFRSYPDEVQKRVLKNQELKRRAPKKTSILLTMISNMLMFAVIFFVMGIIFKNAFKFSNYLSAFVYFLILGEGLNLFDLIVIDLLWWRNSKRIRFSCVPQIEMYKNPRKHIESFFRGIITFAISAVIGALCVII